MRHDAHVHAYYANRMLHQTRHLKAAYAVPLFRHLINESYFTSVGQRYYGELRDPTFRDQDIKKAWEEISLRVEIASKERERMILAEDEVVRLRQRLTQLNDHDTVSASREIYAKRGIWRMVFR